MAASKISLVDMLLKGVVGLLLTIALSVSGWSLKQHFATSEKLAVMQTTLKQIQEDKEWKNQKDEIDRMHWKYNSWSREHINRLYQMQGKELPEPPKLD